MLPDLPAWCLRIWPMAFRPKSKYGHQADIPGNALAATF